MLVRFFKWGPVDLKRLTKYIFWAIHFPVILKICFRLSDFVDISKILNPSIVSTVVCNSIVLILQTMKTNFIIVSKSHSQQQQQICSKTHALKLQIDPQVGANYLLVIPAIILSQCTFRVNFINTTGFYFKLNFAANKRTKRLFSGFLLFYTVKTM